MINLLKIRESDVFTPASDIIEEEAEFKILQFSPTF